MGTDQIYVYSWIHKMWCWTVRACQTSLPTQQSLDFWHIFLRSHGVFATSTRLWISEPPTCSPSSHPRFRFAVGVDFATQAMDDPSESIGNPSEIPKVSRAPSSCRSSFWIYINKYNMMSKYISYIYSISFSGPRPSKTANGLVFRRCKPSNKSHSAPLTLPKLIWSDVYLSVIIFVGGWPHCIPFLDQVFLCQVRFRDMFSV